MCPCQETHRDNDYMHIHTGEHLTHRMQFWKKRKLKTKYYRKINECVTCEILVRIPEIIIDSACSSFSEHLSDF